MAESGLRNRYASCAVLSRSRHFRRGNIDQVEISPRHDLPGIPTEIGDAIPLQFNRIAVTAGTGMSQAQQTSGHGHQTDTVQPASCCKIAT